jgi:hypothetical protein
LFIWEEKEMSIDKMPIEEGYKEICKAGFVGSFEDFKDYKENYSKNRPLILNEDDPSFDLSDDLF